MYDIIEVELRGVQQALQSSRAVSTGPPPSEAPELGDEPTQLHRLADVTEAHLRRTRRNRTCHRGPKASAKSSHRAVSSCIAGEGCSPNKV
jgi:hypothetical protein